MTSFLIYIFLGLGLITLLISKSKFFVPMLIIGLLIGSSHLVTKNLGKLKSMIPRGGGATMSTATLPFQATTTSTAKKEEWKEISKKQIDFSRLKVERFNQKLSYPKIPIGSISLEPGTYRIKLDGNWEFFMSNGEWKQFPWLGKTYTYNLPEFRPDKSKEFCAVILLNNGEDITPVNEDGFILNSTGSINLSVKLNVIMRTDEFYSDKISEANKLTLRNSEKKPLMIIIEKEV